MDEGGCEVLMAQFWAYLHFLLVCCWPAHWLISMAAMMSLYSRDD